MGHIMFKIGYFGTTVGCVVGPLKVAASSGFGSTWQLHSSLTDHLFKIGKEMLPLSAGKTAICNATSILHQAHCMSTYPLENTQTVTGHIRRRWAAAHYHSPPARTNST